MQDDNTSAERVRLRVLGISFNQIHADAYALILAQENGPYRLPIIIGSSEAQSIAIKMEGIIPPRPMTHDLFVSFAHAFGVTLRDVFIYKFESGIFSAELTFSDGDRTIVLDSRTSDAIAIAIRTHTPIYTTRKILEDVGFVSEDPGNEVENDVDIASDMSEAEDEQNSPKTYRRANAPATSDSTFEPKIENLAVEELERKLARLIEEENYEEAARVSEVLRRKRGE